MAIIIELTAVRLLTPLQAIRLAALHLSDVAELTGHPFFALSTDLNLSALAVRASLVSDEEIL